MAAVCVLHANHYGRVTVRTPKGTVTSFGIESLLPPHPFEYTIWQPNPPSKKKERKKKISLASFLLSRAVGRSVGRSVRRYFRRKPAVS